MVGKDTMYNPTSHIGADSSDGCPTSDGDGYPPANGLRRAVEDGPGSGLQPGQHLAAAAIWEHKPMNERSFSLAASLSFE